MDVVFVFVLAIQIQMVKRLKMTRSQETRLYTFKPIYFDSISHRIVREFKIDVLGKTNYAPRSLGYASDFLVFFTWVRPSEASLAPSGGECQNHFIVGEIREKASSFYQLDEKNIFMLNGLAFSRFST